jgi:hypothetical protein
MCPAAKFAPVLPLLCLHPLRGQQESASWQGVLQDAAGHQSAGATVLLEHSGMIMHCKTGDMMAGGLVLVILLSSAEAPKTQPPETTHLLKWCRRWWWRGR